MGELVIQKCYLQVTCFLIIFAGTVSGETLQRIRFYSEPNKGGTNESFTEGGEIEPNSLVYNARSYCVEDGLWVITVRTAESYNFHEWLGGRVVGEVCRNKQQIENKYVGIRLVGDRDLEMSTLSLFPEVRWEGEEYEVQGEDEADEDEVPYKSFVLTGTLNYEIFPLRDFEGDDPICLVANADSGSQLKYGITSNFTTSIKYGSSRVGCAGYGPGGDGNGTQTTTQRNTAISVSQSYFSSAFSHLIHLLLLNFSRKIVF